MTERDRTPPFIPKIASKTEQEGHDHLVCPNCGAEMCGGRIYEDWARKMTAPGTVLADDMTAEEYAQAYGAGPLVPEERRTICGGKEIGIETPDYDGVSLWLFPCCGATYSRWTGERVEDWKRPERDGA